MIESRRRPLLPLTLAALVAVAVPTVWAVTSSPGGPPRAAAADGTSDASDGVVVTGTGEVSAVPDVLHVDLGISVRMPTVDKAIAAGNSALRAMRSAVISAGVASRDVRTSNVGVSPVFDNEGRVVSGYAVDEGLTVTIRSLSRGGTVISSAVRAGGDAARVNGVSLSLSDDTAVRDQARQKAFTAAQAEAQLYAKAAGRTLGQVMRIDETAVPGPGVIYDKAAAASLPAAAAPVPIEPGTQQVSASVTVRWALV